MAPAQAATETDANDRATTTVGRTEPTGPCVEVDPTMGPGRSGAKRHLVTVPAAGPEAGPEAVRVDPPTATGRPMMGPDAPMTGPDRRSGETTVPEVEGAGCPRSVEARG